MKMLQAINLALTFLLELGMLAAFAYWGFITGNGLVAQLLLGIGVPAIVIIIWGSWLAPKSTRRLRGLPYWLVTIAIFSLAIAALYSTGQTTLALVFATVYAVNVLLRLIWKQ